MSPDRIHLRVAEAREHSERALCGIGYDAEEARIIADHAIDAALCGYEYSGLAKLLNILEHRRFKRPRSAMKVLRETELSTLYDGGNNVGMLVMYHAARAASEKAKARGISVVGVTNSWMSGRSAYLHGDDRPGGPRRHAHGRLGAQRRPVRRHAAGSWHQSDRIRHALVARAGRLRHGNLRVHGHRSGLSR
jgi:hypothetical protein